MDKLPHKLIKCTDVAPLVGNTCISTTDMKIYIYNGNPNVSPTTFNYYIHEFYRHESSDVKYRLLEVIGFKFYFDRGHWCTDLVFMDMIRDKTGNRVSNEGTQLNLF